MMVCLGFLSFETNMIRLSVYIILRFNRIVNKHIYKHLILHSNARTAAQPTVRNADIYAFVWCYEAETPEIYSYNVGECVGFGHNWLIAIGNRFGRDLVLSYAG